MDKKTQISMYDFIDFSEIHEQIDSTVWFALVRELANLNWRILEDQIEKKIKESIECTGNK